MINFKYFIFLFIIIPLIACKAKEEQNVDFKTICNPINLKYRFVLVDGGTSWREAADPSMINFKGE